MRIFVQAYRLAAPRMHPVSSHPVPTEGSRMELRLIIGYSLLVIFIGTLSGFVSWRRERQVFEKRGGKQKKRR